MSVSCIEACFEARGVQRARRTTRRAQGYNIASGTLVLLVTGLPALITITARLARLLAATANRAVLIFPIIVLCLLLSLTTLTLTALILAAAFLV